MAKQKKQKNHRGRILQQARHSIRKGRRIVPIPRGTKGPVVAGWPQLHITEKDLPKYFGAQDNIGWITGTLSGDLVDIDLDCAEAVVFGRVFLPATDRVHGRAGRKMSHYWYSVTPTPQPTKFIDVDGACLVEIRSDGQQTLVPPSLHPNGERLVWKSTGDPSRVDGTTLCKAVQKIAAAALLVRHWAAQGQRHDAAKALAGMLLRAGWEETETADFIRAVADVAGDDESELRAINVASTAKRMASGGTATGAPTLAQILGNDVVDRLRRFLQLGPQGIATVASNAYDWPEPALLGEELPKVRNFDLDLLPQSLRPLVDDISERMQTPPDYAGAAAVTALAGCVNRRARIQPKAADDSWSIVPNLWGAIVAPPGFMKTPTLHAITAPLNRIEDFWRAEYKTEIADYEHEKAQAELRVAVWREQCKKAIRDNQPEPVQPDASLVVPVERRLITTDATFEKLHEILHSNPAGLMVVRDELTGWLAGLDREGREGERTFFLQAWSGDQPYTMDRIGRGSIHVPEVCVSLIGNIQPARLRWYLGDAVAGGANDDGLFQRFQVMVWPDPPSKEWVLVDRPPDSAARSIADRIFSRLANLSTDNPIRLRFERDAQGFFYQWLAALEKRLRAESGLAAPMVSHLSKYRSLMPTVAGLYEMADRIADETYFRDEDDASLITLDHASQAARFCEYLESHAQRVYSCVVSPECRAARDLGRHLSEGKLPETFATRDVYLKGWSGIDKPEWARAALAMLEDAGWVRRVKAEPSLTGGRPTEMWEVNPKIKKK